ncbi:MAG: class I SAM-dependent methyltransferase [Alphaproteobacteria bacterium]|nr:class I SAM-dependent methyltransferase [Alphaproteobacteria bacterium]
MLEQLVSRRPSRCLEIGCGSGKFLEAVALKIKPAIICAVDLSDGMLLLAKKRMRRFEKDIELDLRPGDVTRLPWADHAFDAIVASTAIHTWPEPLASLRQLRKLVAADGRVILVAQRKGSPSDALRGSDAGSAGERALLEGAGFSVVQEQQLSRAATGFICVCV